MSAVLFVPSLQTKLAAHGWLAVVHFSHALFSKNKKDVECRKDLSQTFSKSNHFQQREIVISSCSLILESLHVTFQRGENTILK